jgi:hypothetical protein
LKPTAVETTLMQSQVNRIKSLETVKRRLKVQIKKLKKLARASIHNLIKNGIEPPDNYDEILDEEIITDEEDNAGPNK